MLADLVKRTRSVRRFHQDDQVEPGTLRELVDLARLSASGANLQPLKYALVTEPEMCARIFPCLTWAAWLKDWPGPEEGERPAAYIVILLDTEVSKDPLVDHGIAAQSIMLGANEKGLGGCMMAAVKRRQVAAILDLPGRYRILLVLALGKPKEEVVIDPIDPGGDTRYWRDEKAVHHVPKRALEEVIVR